MARESLSLAKLNDLSLLGFVDALFPLYPHAVWILPLAHAQRPFLSLDHLHRVLAEIVASADPAAKKGMVERQPDFLAAREPAPERDAAERLEEPARRALRKAQADYQKKFGFPLVLSLAALKAAEQDPVAVAAARLESPLDQEIGSAADEVTRIARHRLAELVAA